METKVALSNLLANFLINSKLSNKQQAIDNSRGAVYIHRIVLAGWPLYWTGYGKQM